jgi:hypothetical protein
MQFVYGFAMEMRMLQLKNIGHDFHKEEFQIDTCLVAYHSQKVG